MFRAIGRFSERYAPYVVAFWVVLAVALVATAPSLTEVGTQDQADFLPLSSPSQQANRELERLFPNDPTRDSTLLVFSRDDAPLTDSDRAYIGSVVSFLQSPEMAPHIKILQSAATSPELAPFLRAGSGGAELVVLALHAPPFTESTNAVVERIRDHLEAGGPPGLGRHVTGISAIAKDQGDAILESFDRTAIVTILLVLMILVFVYRSAVAPMVPLVTIGIAFLVAQGAVGYLAQHGFEVASMAGTFMVVMVFGAGTDYCLFLVSRYREELEGGDPVPATVRRTMTVIGGVIAASAATVIVGFLSQLTAEFGIYRTMGPAMGVAIFITLVAALTLTPAMLRLLGTRTFWPASLAAVRQHGDEHSRRWARLAAAVRRRPVETMLAGIIVLQLPTAGLGFGKQSFDLVADLPGASDARQGFAALSRHYQGGTLSPVHLLIRADGPMIDDGRLGAVDALTDRLRRMPNVGEVRSITQPAGAPLTTENVEALGGAGDAGAFGLDPNTVDLSPLFNAMASPEGLRFTGPVLRAYPQLAERLEFLRGADGQSTRLVIALKGSPYDGKALSTIRAIDDVAAETLAGTALGDARLAVGGPSAFYADMQRLSSQDLRVIMTTLLGGIFVVLALLLRSAVAPFYLLATVVLSFTATMGLTVAVFQGIFDSSGISFWLPSFLFVILVALGADYNIFIMSRIREEAAEGHDVAEAAMRGLVLTGPVITSAGFILAGTFAGLMLAPLPNLRQIGFAVTVGVLLDTFVVRSLLVPSITLLLGRWAFWPYVPGEGRMTLQRRHVGLAGAGVLALATVLVAIALTGPTDDTVTRVDAVAAADQEATAGGDEEAPAADGGAQVTSPTTLPTVVAGAGVTRQETPTTAASTSAAPTTNPDSPPARVVVPAAGGWRFHVEGTRKIGAAGSRQPFSEDVTTAVTRVGGAGDAPEVRLVTESGSGRQDDRRRYGPAAVELLETHMSASGMSFGGRVEPPQTLLRWPARVGDRWAGDFSLGDVRGRAESKVTGTRTVAVAGRSYTCYLVQTDSTFSGAAQGEQHQTACWVAELGMSVDDQSSYSGTYNGIPFEINQRSVLVTAPG